MKNSEKKWLEPAAWASLLNAYQTLCQAQKVDPFYDQANFEKARKYLESHVGKSLTLVQTLEVCRKCYQCHPFVFNNGNTFASFAKKLVEDWAQSMPKVEAQMLLTTVGHFVTEKITRRELLKVLDFLKPSWEKFQAEAAATVVIRPQLKAEPALQPEPKPELARARELIAS